jgi:hypothetical protein
MMFSVRWVRLVFHSEELGRKPRASMQSLYRPYISVAWTTHFVQVTAAIGNFFSIMEISSLLPRQQCTGREIRPGMALRQVNGGEHARFTVLERNSYLPSSGVVKRAAIA